MNEPDRKRAEDRPDARQQPDDEERRRRSEEVTEGSEESFPASDPPATSYPGDGGSD